MAEQVTMEIKEIRDHLPAHESCLRPLRLLSRCSNIRFLSVRLASKVRTTPTIKVKLTSQQHKPFKIMKRRKTKKDNEQSFVKAPSPLVQRCLFGPNLRHLGLLLGPNTSAEPGSSQPPVVERLHSSALQSRGPSSGGDPPKRRRVCCCK